MPTCQLNHFAPTKLQPFQPGGVGICTMLNHRIMTGLMGATLVATTMANVQESPYRVIAVRNPFGLRPIPIPVEKAPEPPPGPPLPEIKFTGITTLLGAAMVTLQYEDKEAKKMEFPPLLREGEKYKNLV